MPKPSFLARFTDIRIIFGKFCSFLHQKPPIILKHRTLAHKTLFLALINTTNDQILDRKAAQQKFDADYADISVILNYLLTFDKQVVYIAAANGKATVGFQEINIEDERVNSAIYNLIVTKGYHSIEKEAYTIFFTQWVGVRDVCSGLAYAVNGGTKLQVSFLTSAIAMNKANWYYCVCDYEEWRVMQQKTNQNK